MRRPWHSLAFIAPLLLSPVNGSAICIGPADLGKTPVVSVDMKSFEGSTVLCGEDAAAAAARIATHRKTGTTDGQAVLELARAFNDALAAKNEYSPPDVLDAATPLERPRVLKTGGLYSRRAVDHSKKNEFGLAVADLIRALLRPGIDETAVDRLTSTMKDFLRKADKKRKESASNGDISELFEALELEDDAQGTGPVDPKALKSVYRKLSVKYHPDKSKESADRFNQIRDAYEILSDPVKVLLYDTSGLELVKKFEGGKDEGISRGGNFEQNVNVNLEQVYEGYTKSLSVPRRMVCRSCRLQPSLPRCAHCQQCPGEMKERQVWLNPHQYRVEQYDVPSEEKCLQVLEDLILSVERGTMSGDVVHFPYMADQTPKQIPGDVLVSVKVKQHARFKRVGNDLIVSVKVSLFEALLGFQRELRHLDGHIVKFGVERGTVMQPGMGMVIENEGMPLREDPSVFGKLMVKFDIGFPQRLPVGAEGDLLASALQGLGQGPLPLDAQGSARSYSGRRSEL